jgi:hypothetical protein
MSAGTARAFSTLAQNARLVASAERYYRVMYHGAAESWNLRDRHMFETLDQLLAWRGTGSKAVVWAHNSHIGDAAATEMGEIRGEINIGQLCRERFADAAVLIGFGTDRGTVAAAPFRLSRNHFMIEKRDGSYYVRDLRSTLGTIVNGEPIGDHFRGDDAPLRAGENEVIAGGVDSPFAFSVFIT